MTIRVTAAVSRSYSEISQPNPMRWEVLKRVGDTFNPMTGKIKCRDFFNDMVMFRQFKKVFCIYGFNNEMDLGKAGVWFRISQVSDKATFRSNLEMLNDALTEQLGFGIQFFDHRTGILLFIPEYFWTKTYYISALTGLIRLLSYGVKFNSWAELMDNTLYIADKAFDDKCMKLIKAWGFKVPAQYNDYVWYAGDTYNSVKTKPGSVSISVLHNNGVRSWSNYVSV